MTDYLSKQYPILDMFPENWALVSVGNLEKNNGCTIGWGSFEPVDLSREKRRHGHGLPASGPVYLRAAEKGRYLYHQLLSAGIQEGPGLYGLSLWPQGRQGGGSGPDAGGTPGRGLSYKKEAKISFVCHKLYQHQFAKEDLDPEIQEYYKANPAAYPVNAQGEWEPHVVFVGEIRYVDEKK